MPLSRPLSLLAHTHSISQGNVLMALHHSVSLHMNHAVVALVYFLAWYDSTKHWKHTFVKTNDHYFQLEIIITQ